MLNNIEIPSDHVHITEEPLGSGSFGKVYLANYCGRNAAAKVYRMEESGDDGDDHRHHEEAQEHCRRQETPRARFLHELETMKRLQSPHTVQVYGAVTCREGELVLVMELMSGGDLRSYLKAARDPLAKDTLRTLVRDICAGMTFLHSKDVVHGDLKSPNVLLDGDGRAKVSAAWPCKVQVA